MYGPLPSYRLKARRHDDVIIGISLWSSMGTDEAKNWQKKGWKNNNPKSSLRNGVSPESSDCSKNRTDKKKTKVLSYVQSKKHSIHLSDYILYPVHFNFHRGHFHTKIVIFSLNRNFKQNFMVFMNWTDDKKFLKFMNNHECIIWMEISLGRIS